MYNKEMVAVLLAGGQGSRLGILTKNIAKPAVPYGGKYRIIDFTLSNCVNSGIDTVGVATQYLPRVLNSYIGIGKAWDLDRINGGVTILSPHLKSENGEWYKGTANAVYQNIDYVDSMNPEYVIILSGDHIYKMDYSLMLDYHKAKKAEATISVIDVPLDEANRYGIMNTKSDGSIYEFEEKPQNPKSTLASMGVYIFNWKLLKDYLIRDEEDSNSNNDFGKNIIPKMLQEERKIYAYRFEGYWKDVGTIDSYWESNMDLKNRVPAFNLFDTAWKIYAPNAQKAANYIGPKGNIKRSIISEGCTVLGKITDSVVFPGVFIDEDVEIVDSIILSNCKVLKNSQLQKAILCEGAVVGKNVKIGFGEDIDNVLKPTIYNSGITVVGEEAYIPDNANIGKNVMIDTKVTAEDFQGLEITSGFSVLKGGVVT
jgi:glucose-1-phosphate adenylyltransferase